MVTSVLTEEGKSAFLTRFQGYETMSSVTESN